MRVLGNPIRRQTINAQFKIGEYDEICSDKLFFIVGPQSAYVLNPDFRSVSTLYADIWI